MQGSATAVLLPPAVLISLAEPPTQCMPVAPELSASRTPAARPYRPALTGFVASVLPLLPVQQRLDGLVPKRTSPDRNGGREIGTAVKEGAEGDRP